MITEFCRLLSLLVVFIVCLPAVAERLILASLSCDGIQGFEASIGDDGSTSREGVLAYLPRLVFIEGHSSHTPPNGNTWDLPGLIRVEITHGGTLTAEGTRLRRVVCPNGLIGWQIVDAMQFEILGTEKQGIRTGISDNRISDEQLMREVAVITNGTHTWVLAVSGLLCECTDIKSRPVFIPARVFLWQLHGTSISA